MVAHFSQFEDLFIITMNWQHSIV